LKRNRIWLWYATAWKLFIPTAWSCGLFLLLVALGNGTPLRMDPRAALAVGTVIAFPAPCRGQPMVTGFC